jgi:hypothetical protein
MSTADGGLPGALVQMRRLAEQFGALDSREADHHQDVREAMTGLGESVDDLRSTVSGHGDALGSVDELAVKLAGLAAAIEPLLPPEPGPVYHPAPPPKWWTPGFLDSEEGTEALARLRAWVRGIYRTQYGHLAARLGECWDRHPLCLIELDWVSELWQVLYIRANRTAGVLSSQAEFSTRFLPAVAGQLATETTSCEHRRQWPAAVNGWGSR